MPFMNEPEILRACYLHEHHPVLGPATTFLRDFMTEVNSHSDGWPHWYPPVHAAEGLIDLIRGAPNSATEQRFTNTLKPIRAFYTRRGNASGMKFPEVTLTSSSKTPSPQMTLFSSPATETKPAPLKPRPHNTGILL